MENGTAPDEIQQAIDDGDRSAVEAWLDSGGDPNAMFTAGDNEADWSLLRRAARRGRAEIISLLLSRGADIDATDRDGRTALYQMLNYWTAYGSLPALRLLLSRGPDVNMALKRSSGFATVAGRTPLHNTAAPGNVDPVRMLLRAGADPELRDSNGCTAEEHARRGVNRSSRSMYAEQCADLLRDVRLAGGWVRYVLQPKYDLLVLRALCHRGRATFSARTPEVLVRLFGAPDGRRRTRSTRATEGVRVHLPDPLFWRILEFALGTAYDYPWVRQRVRARAAAVAAAE